MLFLASTVGLVVGTRISIDHRCNTCHQLWNRYPDCARVHALGNHTRDLRFVQRSFNMWKGLLTITSQRKISSQRHGTRITHRVFENRNN